MSDDRFGIPPVPEVTDARSLLHYLIQLRGLLIKWINDLEQNKITLSEVPASVTDHGALTGLLDDDHTQYVLKTILSSETTGEGGSDVGFDDTGSLTTAVDVNDIINRILDFITYVEAAAGDGSLDWSNADNSHHFMTWMLHV